MKKYLLILSFFSMSVFAKQFEIVKEHSKVSFDVDYMVMTKVQGQFKGYYGFFELNEAENVLSHVKVNIIGDTVDTSDAKRDFHLKAQEFFFTTEYPEMIFTAAGPVTIALGAKFKLPGTLTMRGVSKPLTLEGVYKGKMKDPWNKENYFFTLTGELNRKDFGMVWNKQMDSGGYLVGDEVRLDIVVQSQVLGEKTPFSTHMVPNTKGIQERRDLKMGKIKKLSTSTDPLDHQAKPAKK